jgi:hypothetical protein
MDSNSAHPEDTLPAVDGLNVLLSRFKQSLKRLSFDFWLVALAGFLAWASFQFGERVAMRDGLGWDGEVYWSWVKDFPREIQDVGIDAYRIQRILPSCALHYGFRLFQVHASIRNTLRGFAAINILSIMLVAHFWCLTATHLQISDRGKWLGFMGLILNFAVLKLSGYYPVLIDMEGYASASAIAYCYLTERRIGLVIATIIGAFLWPTHLYVGAILLLFPRKTEAIPDSGESFTQRWATVSRIDIILAGLAAFYIYIWSLYACNRIQIPMFGGLFPIRSVLGLSLVITMGYVFLALRPLLNDGQLYRLPRSLTWSQIRWTIGTLLLVVGVKFVQSCISNRPGYFGFSVYCFVVGITAVAKPGLFYLSHLVYYGPFWLLGAFHWPAICRQIHRQNGIGLTLVIAIGICHSLDAESRHIIYLLPLLVPFIVQVIDRFDWSHSQLWFLTVISALASKFWLVIGGPFLDNSNLYPDQYFWMNIGSFMTDQSYLWQLAAAIICAMLMNQVLFRTSTRPSPIRPLLDVDSAADSATVRSS